MKRHLLNQGGALSVQPLRRGVLLGECGSDFYRYADTCVKYSFASRVGGFKGITFRVPKLPRLSAALSGI